GGGNPRGDRRRGAGPRRLGGAAGRRQRRRAGGGAVGRRGGRLDRPARGRGIHRRVGGGVGRVLGERAGLGLRQPDGVGRVGHHRPRIGRGPRVRPADAVGAVRGRLFHGDGRAAAGGGAPPARADLLARRGGGLGRGRDRPRGHGGRRWGRAARWAGRKHRR